MTRRMEKAPDVGAVKEPHARIYQYELPYLKAIGATEGHKWLLAVIRIRIDGRTGECHDTIDVLADKADMAPATVKHRLRWLRSHGLIQRKATRVQGGPRGLVYRWQTRPLRYADWPLMRGPLADLSSEDEGSARAPMKGPLASDEGSAPRRVIQRPRPEISPERDALRKNTRKDGDHDAVQGRVLRWVKARAGLRFADDLAGTWLAKEIETALRVGHSEGDIDRAIAPRLSEPYADPRQLGAWVDEVKAARLESERSLARSREILAEREREEAVIAAERAQPGYAERHRQVYAEGLALLRRPREEPDAASTPLVTIPLVSPGTTEARPDRPAGARVT